jgi:hypothetical protein
MIEELERLLAAASPRPWRDTAESGEWWVEGADGAPVCDSEETWNRQADIDLMVAAVNALPALLRVAKAADKALGATVIVLPALMPALLRMANAEREAADVVTALEELEAALYNLRSLEAGND